MFRQLSDSVLSLFPHFNQESVGAKGERLARAYLTRHGYRHLTSNFRAPRWGEIDLIFSYQTHIIFVEVKTRIGDQQTDPLESITKRKQHVLKRTAQFYLAEHEILDYSARFDVIIVQFAHQNDRDPHIKHFVNAF